MYLILQISEHYTISHINCKSETIAYLLSSYSIAYFKYLRSPALGGSTTASKSGFDALQITEDKISSARPEKNSQLVTLFSAALASASCTACGINSNPKTCPHF